MKIIEYTLKKWQQTNLMLLILAGIVSGAVLALTVPGISAISMLGDLFVGALKAIAPVLVAVLVLREKTDALAIVSVCYYVLLITNMIHAFMAKERLFAVALCLFILCDTVIGLQVAAGAYLPITEGSALYKIIFMNFNLAWFFYLPSQVLIAKRTWSK